MEEAVFTKHLNTMLFDPGAVKLEDRDGLRRAMLGLFVAYGRNGGEQLEAADIAIRRMFDEFGRKEHTPHEILHLMHEHGAPDDAREIGTEKKYEEGK